MNRSIEQWLDAYAGSHRNPTNKLIHWFCVPVITWTVLALLWCVQVPGARWLNLATISVVAALVFYWRLSKSLALGMLLFSGFSFLLIEWHVAVLVVPVWQTSIALFIIAWIGQFIGHKVEGQKPSFFEDVQFLLIGPVWLLSFVFKKIGIQLH